MSFGEAGGGANWKWGLLCDWSGLHIWPFRTDLYSKAGTRNREAVIYESSPGHLGWMVAEVLVSFLDCH